MLTRLPSEPGVAVILVSTGERATAVRCDDPEGFHIVLPPYPGGGEGGCIGGKGPDRDGPADWIVTRADGCVLAVKASGAVPVAAVEAAK